MIKLGCLTSLEEVILRLAELLQLLIDRAITDSVAVPLVVLFTVLDLSLVLPHGQLLYLSCVVGGGEALTTIC